MTHKLSVLACIKKEVWVVEHRGAGRLIPVQPDLFYSLISQTGFCLRDKWGEAGKISKCDCPTDSLSITASSGPLYHPLAAEQSISTGLNNLSGYTGALTTGTCFSTLSALNTPEVLCLSISSQPYICLLPWSCTWEQTFPPLNPAPKNNHTLLYPG